MVKKKIDQRIRTLIENGVQTHHRSLFVMVGDHGANQVANLHYILSKAQVARRPSVLWCYKNELTLSSNKKKRMKQMKKKKSLGLLDAARIEEDPFELFLSSTDIRYAYYHETDKILGNTFGMCVLQDFEALTPNLLARTIETVQGGGIVILLLQTLTSLKQLYTMTMDVHSRYRTEGHHDAVARFNERFLLSLAGCETCLVVDDQLNVLPLSAAASINELKPINNESIEGLRTPEEIELEKLKAQLGEDPKNKVTSKLINLAKTLDQAKVIQSAGALITEQNHALRMTVSMTAARGRGKSAALGLTLAAAVATGYGNIFVTAPSPENLKTLFEFIFKGLDALGYSEHLDYDIVQATHAEFNRAVVRVNIFKGGNGHRQTILYIHPQDSQLLSQAELIVIDEAAAIPLPLVQALCSGPQLVFMASTINGYEGTGRSLSLKLIQQLRNNSGMPSSGARILKELSLSEPIRYGSNDPIEKWLNNLLCLDVASLSLSTSLKGAFANPELCELYAVNRDTLFSFHKASEGFLQKMMALYVGSHYKNTPNDLQLMSDAPAHRLYVLLAPVDERTATSLPEILCVLQVCFEGEISKQVVLQSLARGKRAGGDLIPWTMSQQFQDDDFCTLSGARIVRVAVHPELQGMGYGSRAIQQLEAYFRGQLHTGDDEDNPNALDEDDENRLVASNNFIGANLQEEVVKPRTNLKPLLVKLSDRKPVLLDWLGVSFGLTPQLFKFWHRMEYQPVYLRQTTNDITGEHTAIMLKRLGGRSATDWLDAFNADFCRRFVALSGYQFRSFPASLSLDILVGHAGSSESVVEVAKQITPYDLKRLEAYANNMVDYHIIMDLLPTMARHYFISLPRDMLSLSPVQAAILLALGLQHRTMDELEKELKLPVSQLLAMFIKTARKFSKLYRDAHIQRIEQKSTNKVHTEDKDNSENTTVATGKRDIEEIAEWAPTAQNLDEDLDEAAREARERLRERQRELVSSLDLSQYAIGGDDEEWNDEIKKKSRNLQGAVLNISAKKSDESDKPNKSLAKGLYASKDVELVKKAKKSKYAKK
jgi:N-acetyltransferase 10